MQSPPALAGSSGSTGAAPSTPDPPTHTHSPPSCPALFPCKSYRFQWCSQNCQSHVQLGLCLQGLAHPMLQPLWATAGRPPSSTARSTSQKTCVRRGRREVPAPRDPTEHMGLPVAKSWAGATLGWFLLSCRVGASLDPSQQVANSQTPAQTPFEGSPHHPPPHLPQPGRDQCITYLHPSRSLSRSHPVIHCSRCLRTWPHFQCIPGPRTVP